MPEWLRVAGFGLWTLLRSGPAKQVLQQNDCAGHPVRPPSPFSTRPGPHRQDLTGSTQREAPAGGQRPAGPEPCTLRPPHVTLGPLHPHLPECVPPGAGRLPAVSCQSLGLHALYFKKPSRASSGIPQDLGVPASPAALQAGGRRAWLRSLGTNLTVIMLE